MRIISLIIFVILCYSCNSSKCAGTAKINGYQFLRKLENVKRSAKEKNGISADEFREAILYLAIVTGINSKANYSSTFGYTSKSEFREEVKNWHNWYKKNKCKLSEDYIDSAFKSVNIKRSQ